MVGFRRLLVLAVLFALPALAFAQAAEIILTWDSMTEEDFEGALVCSSPSGSVDVVRSSVSGKSADGTVEYSTRSKKWTVSRFGAGLYQFYVANIFADDDFAGWDRYEWSAEDGVLVQLTMGGKTQTFRPPEKPGLVWYVFSIAGGDGEVTSLNTVMPFKRTVYGLVKDAVTGKALTGVDVTLRSVADGKVVSSERVDEYYMIHADTGRYLLQVAKDDYIALEMPVEFIKSEFPIRLDAHLSTFLASAQYRVVLSWGSDPPDLDAHVIGPVPSSTQTFHISYRNMRAFGDRHFLDIDDTNGYGPETITLGGVDPGLYTFCVHDYSHLSSRSSSKLSFSGATLRLYRERELLKTVSIPSGVPGNLWRAFSLDGSTGALTVLGELRFESSPANVR